MKGAARSRTRRRRRATAEWDCRRRRKRLEPPALVAPSGIKRLEDLGAKRSAWRGNRFGRSAVGVRARVGKKRIHKKGRARCALEVAGADAVLPVPCKRAYRIGGLLLPNVVGVRAPWTWNSQTMCGCACLLILGAVLHGAFHPVCRSVSSRQAATRPVA